MNLKNIREIFSEPNGPLSFSRVASGVVLVFAIIWVSYVVLTRYVIPDVVGLAGVLGALYGANQLGNLLNKKDNDSEK